MILYFGEAFWSIYKVALAGGMIPLLFVSIKVICLVSLYPPKFSSFEKDMTDLPVPPQPAMSHLEVVAVDCNPKAQEQPLPADFQSQFTSLAQG